MDNNSIERCNSAPIIAWERLNQTEISLPPQPIISPGESESPLKLEPNKLIKPQGVRLRRHSSLTRGLLHNVRKISESDERSGEAKVNNSINLSSSTEKLNMSSTPPSPSLLSSPSNMFRPIKNSPTWDFQPSTPEKDASYGLRPRNSIGKQCTRPSSRKRSSLGEPMTIDKPIKRLRLTEQNKTDEHQPSPRTISSDSGIFMAQNKKSSTSTSSNNETLSTATDVETFHWWHRKTHNRTRRLSTESIVSTDSITREINKPL